jgi:hypothetical protein
VHEVDGTTSAPVAMTLNSVGPEQQSTGRADMTGTRGVFPSI